MWLAAFLTGLLGSLHCVVMCGPLAALSLRNSNKWGVDPLLYNTGRVFSYIILGQISYAASKIIFLTGFQDHLSMIIGVLLLLGVISHWISLKIDWEIYKYWSGLIRRLFGRAVNNTNRTGKILLGIINGFLPCGLVYYAMVGALSAATWKESVVYMTIFGLGTFPAMWFMPFLLKSVNVSFDWNKWVPIVFAMIGVLLIVRGLHLGIPYLSPQDFSHDAHLGHELLCK